jgi:hypothetical protein
LVVTEGEGIDTGLRNVKKETYSDQYATAAQAGMGRAHTWHAREKAGGWPGGEAAGPIGLKATENSFPNKNWIFEFTKALEICRKRFRRNFGMRIFPKFF